MKKRMLASLSPNDAKARMRQIQAIAYLSLLLNISLFMTLIFVLRKG